MVADPIGDLLTRIRNSQKRQHKSLGLPYSRMLLDIVKILKEEGFIEAYEVKDDEEKSFRKILEIELKYNDGKPVISSLQRISKPGVRIYVGYRDIPRILGGIGMTVVSTPKGVMTGEKAVAQKVGGELLCKIW